MKAVSDYIGHPSQVSGVEEHILKGGKGDGMRLFIVRNGMGLELTIAADRAADLPRVSFMGQNMGFFAPAGYVAPQYYVGRGLEFLKSFNAGFMTTCGLTAAGAPSTDNGEEIPLHGNISNVPAERCCWEECCESIVFTAYIRDASLFGHKLSMKRTYTVSKTENAFTLSDEIENLSTAECDFMLLYHCNMGYPLLSETAELFIPEETVFANTDFANENMDNRFIVERPQANIDERCYFYELQKKDGRSKAGIFNPAPSLGLLMDFDASVLDKFTEWKMMGVSEYVMGLEPGNCFPLGKSTVRERGELHTLAAGEKAKTEVVFSFFTDREKFDAARNG